MRKIEQNLYYDLYPTPVGEIILVVSNPSLHFIFWKKNLPEVEREFLGIKKSQDHKLIHKVKKQLEEYFSGKREKFDLPLEIAGTDFQKSAWSALREIPYGEIISYQKQAEKLGDKKKARAIGQANKKNPLPIIIPCHRVISKSGAAHGFASGTEVKKFLLEIEGVTFE